jgi:hypothetical protein
MTDMNPLCFSTTRSKVSLVCVSSAVAQYCDYGGCYHSLSEHHRANLRGYFRYSAFSHGFIRCIMGYQCQRGIIQLRDTMIKPGISAATTECNTTPRKNRAQTLPLAFTPSSHTLELSVSSVLIRVPRKAYKHIIVMYHTAALSNWVFWRVWRSPRSTRRMG